MPLRSFQTYSEEQTIALGRQLSHELPNGTVLLVGNLGAGKTTLVKGIVEGRGVAPGQDVSSPTFTLIHEYGEEKPVYHVDLYRLDEEREIESLGLDELFGSGSLVLMEWAERFPALLPARRAEIHIEILPDDSRRITVSIPG